jgi:ubiquinone/menaquinone biosynthesis C-methylase UbiE
MGDDDPVNEKAAGRAFWDANPCGGQWRSYGEFASWVQDVEPYAFDVLDRHEWKGLRVLEVGCGQGVVMNNLAMRGADAYGIDQSVVSISRALDGAAELGHRDRVHASNGDAECLPFADGTFDAVVSFGVLHHTPDTAGAVAEVRRVLKPGGLAIVMLYRTGNPKWWATRGLRAWSRSRQVDRRREAMSAGDTSGTALLELFGVPTMKAFSNTQALHFFEGFSNAVVRNCQPGFRRLADLSGVIRPLAPLLGAIDRVADSAWGFYQVVEARR